MLTTYQVIITRDTTESAVVQVLAHDREEAADHACYQGTHQASALTWTKDDNIPSPAYFGGSVEDIDEVDGIAPTPVEPVEGKPEPGDTFRISAFQGAVKDVDPDSPLHALFEDAAYSPAKQGFIWIVEGLNLKGTLCSHATLSHDEARDYVDRWKNWGFTDVAMRRKPADPDEGALPGRTGPLPVAELGEDEPIAGPGWSKALITVDGQPIPVSMPGCGVEKYTFIPTSELETLRGHLATCEALLTRWSEALYPVGLHGWAVDPAQLAPLARDTRNIAKAIANEKRK